MQLTAKQREKIFLSLGAASMCWSGTPSGIFDSTRCEQIGNELIAALQEGAESLPPSHNSDYAAALRVFDEYARTTDLDLSLPAILAWCRTRLNAEGHSA